jgi:hypothetical protein
MIKKIMIGVVVLVVILGATYLYFNHRGRTLSPPGSASLSKGDLTVSVSYNRPSVRGRVVFGTAEQDALQPYGEYWRFGANEATEITFSKDVSFNGEALKAGTYRMYAVPGDKAFEIGLNSELGQWGYIEPDYTKDLLKTSIPVQTNSTPVEQFTITLVETTDGVDVVADWSTVRLVIPVTH